MSYRDRKTLRKAVVEAAARCFRAQHSFDDENIQRLLRDIGRNLKLALDATDATPPTPGWTRMLRAIWVDGPDSEAARAGRDRRARMLAAGVRDLAALESSWTQCPVCGELLDRPDNDMGDGEWLGHSICCPVAALVEALGEDPHR